MTIDGDNVVTLNNMGRATRTLTEYSLEFVAFAAHAPGPALDIGSGFGLAAVAAMERGVSVIANDMERGHLQAITEAAVAAGLLERLQIYPGRFPEDLDIRHDTLGSIHASQVLHFLTGPELMKGAELMFCWLRRGGKVFTVSGTPYVRTLKQFIPVYEERRRQRVAWPGMIENVHQYSCHPTIRELPRFVHFLDEETIARPFASAGFLIERVEMYKRQGLPEYLKYDGRENVGLIARKP